MKYTDVCSYLTVDYERGRFNVSQCSWVEGAEEQIITNYPTTSNSSSESGSDPTSSPPSPSEAEPGGINTNSGISGGAVAGIVVGIVAFVLLAAIFWIVLRRRRAAKPGVELPRTRPTTPEPSGLSETPELSEETLDSVKVLEVLGKSHGELSGECQIYQLDGLSKEPQRLEMHGSARVMVYELPGSISHPA